MFHSRVSVAVIKENSVPFFIGLAFERTGWMKRGGPSSGSGVLQQSEDLDSNIYTLANIIFTMDNRTKDSNARRYL